MVSRYVQLKKGGANYVGLCPFHAEKSPSFSVSPAKQFYHCFGCGAHGDAIRFLTDHGGMPFMDAVKELAGRAGMEVPAPDPRARDQAERAASLTDIMGAVQKWFAEQLQGLEGAVSQMLAHGVSTGGLFLMVGMLSDRRHTRLISEYGGLKAVMPRLPDRVATISMVSPLCSTCAGLAPCSTSARGPATR